MPSWSLPAVDTRWAELLSLLSFPKIRERLRGRGAAEKRDELPSPHGIDPGEPRGIWNTTRMYRHLPTWAVAGSGPFAHKEGQDNRRLPYDRKRPIHPATRPFHRTRGFGRKHHAQRHRFDPFLVVVEDSTNLCGLEHAADIPQMRHGLLTIALPPPP
jgi:hypothetical protein